MEGSESPHYLEIQMFRDNTVFVVGAGASAEFDMPVGSKLMETIRENCIYKFDHGGLRQGVPVILEHLNDGRDVRDHGDRDWIDQRLKAMARVSLSIDMAESIDEFIYRNSDDPLIAEVGKLQIAYAIAYAEGESLLRADQFNSHSGFARANETWINTFAKVLFNGVKATEIDTIGQNITIICFNYDRCIEWYLERAIVRAYPGTSDGKARDIVRYINIIHPYGTLGSLSEFPFGQVRKLGAMADNIQTWSETVRDPNTVRAIQRAIGKADQIVFLGFAFANQNMELLRSPAEIRDERHVRAYATGYGLHQVVEQAYKENIVLLYKDALLVTAMDNIWVQWQTKSKEFMYMYRYGLTQ
jgi:hypothetical protein